MRLSGFDKNSKQQIGQQNKCPNLQYLIDEDVGRGGWNGVINVTSGLVVNLVGCAGSIPWIPGKQK